MKNAVTLLRNKLVARADLKNLEELKLTAVIENADKAEISKTLAPFHKNARCEFRPDLQHDAAIFKEILRNLEMNYGNSQDLMLEAKISKDLDMNRAKIINALSAKSPDVPETASFYMEIAFEEIFPALTTLIFESVSDANSAELNVEPATEEQLNEILALELQNVFQARNKDLEFYAAHMITLEEIESSSLDLDELELIIRNNLMKNSKALISSYFISLSKEEQDEIKKEYTKIQHAEYENVLSGVARIRLAKRRAKDVPASRRPSASR